MVAAIVCAVFALAGAVTAITFFVKYTEDRDTITGLRQDLSDATASADREQAALRATCAYLGVVSTYDYTDLDGYFDKVLNASTGSWHESFSGSAASLKEAMVSVQSRSNPEETHCGLTSLDGQIATAVGVVKQARSNSITPTSSLTVSMVLTLEEQPDGRWLVSEVETPAQ